MLNPTEIKNAGEGQKVPISRRRALGRLFGLGAGAAAVIALPVPVQAATIAPIVPEWLTSAPGWLVPYLERLALAAPSIHPSQTEQAEYTARFLAKGFESWFQESKEAEDARNALQSQRIEREMAAQRLARAQQPRQVDDRHVAVIRFGRLDRNARRRARRWIARQPVGGQYPVIRLRAGKRYLSAQADVDFLDVVRPEQSYLLDSAADWAQTVFEDFRRAVGRTRGAHYPAISSYMVLCSHQGNYRNGGKTSIIVSATGRVLA